MLIHQSQAGCVIGKAGAKLRDMRQEFGVEVKVFAACCPNSTDRIVRVSGAPQRAVKCIISIVEMLRTVSVFCPDVSSTSNFADVGWHQSISNLSPHYCWLGADSIPFFRFCSQWGHSQQKAMQDEVVIYVTGHPLLSWRCTRLPGCICLQNDLYCVGWSV